jgi:catechol 2,3-dioxygenase-like lactoylglutathione lyase family enzyme
MTLTSFDHIVLCVRDIAATLAFYQRVLGMEPREETPGKWALHFGTAKISLQHPKTLPDIAKATTPGSANFCLVAQGDITQIAARLTDNNVKILQGPGPKIGARGPMQSVYFNDPDGNLLEICIYA